MNNEQNKNEVDNNENGSYVFSKEETIDRINEGIRNEANNIKIRAIYKLRKFAAMFFVIWLIFGALNGSSATYYIVAIVAATVTVGTHLYIIYVGIKDVKTRDGRFKDIDINTLFAILLPIVIIIAIIYLKIKMK